MESSPPISMMVLTFGVKVDGGFALGDDFIDKLRAQKLGDELAGRARHRYALNLLRGDPGKDFGQDPKNRL